MRLEPSVSTIATISIPSRFAFSLSDQTKALHPPYVPVRFEKERVSFAFFGKDRFSRFPGKSCHRTNRTEPAPYGRHASRFTYVTFTTWNRTVGDGINVFLPFVAWWRRFSCWSIARPISKTGPERESVRGQRNGVIVLSRMFSSMKVSTSIRRLCLWKQAGG